jgi:hypothetical protein
MDNQIVVNDYRQMDKILKEERAYLLNMCKKIKKSGCNVLLIQKSILRDAVNELSLHFLAKLKILVVKDIERDEIEFIAKSTGCKPIADIEAFTEDKLGSAELVDEVEKSGARVVKITGVKNPGRTVSVVCTGANSLVLEESERSIHDALCVVRCLVKKRYVFFLASSPFACMSSQSLISCCFVLLPSLSRYLSPLFRSALSLYSLPCFRIVALYLPIAFSPPLPNHPNRSTASSSLLSQFIFILPHPPSLPSFLLLPHLDLTQSSHRRRRRPRDPRLSPSHPIRPNPQGHGSLLLPSLCRSARGHPYNPRRKCRAEPHRDRHRAEEQTCQRGDHCRYQRSQGSSSLSPLLLPLFFFPFRCGVRVLKSVLVCSDADTVVLVDVLQGTISNILEENVLQPLLVSTSAIELATETVCLLLRIDDFQVRHFPSFGLSFAPVVSGLGCES